MMFMSLFVLLFCRAVVVAVVVVVVVVVLACFVDVVIRSVLGVVEVWLGRHN